MAVWMASTRRLQWCRSWLRKATAAGRPAVELLWARAIPRPGIAWEAGRSLLAMCAGPATAAQHGRDCGMAAQRPRGWREGGGTGRARRRHGRATTARTGWCRSCPLSGSRGFAMARIEDEVGGRPVPNRIGRTRLPDRFIRRLMGYRATWFDGLPAFDAGFVYRDCRMLTICGVHVSWTNLE